MRITDQSPVFVKWRTRLDAGASSDQAAGSLRTTLVRSPRRPCRSRSHLVDRDHGDTWGRSPSHAGGFCPRVLLRGAQRSNLDFKFLADLSDTEAADFFEGLLRELSRTINDGDATRLVDHALSWQRRAYGAHLDSKAAFAYDDVPFSILATPLAEARVALLTSSGHFVAGDDPKPFGVDHMTQTKAEARIGEFLRAEPTLSRIPVDTPAGQLRVRHGGYPVDAALIDHNVTFPLRAMRELHEEGVIGEFAADARSFVGATSQLNLRDRIAPDLGR